MIIKLFISSDFFIKWQNKVEFSQITTVHYTIRAPQKEHNIQKKLFVNFNIFALQEIKTLVSYSENGKQQQKGNLDMNYVTYLFTSLCETL